jgi:hypothetical protein
MIYSVFYVSRSRLVMPQDEAVVQALIAGSLLRNRREGITGGLIFSELNFAQFIEGPRPAVTDLMGRISRDTRHNGINILRETELDHRRFEGWRMAYWGPAQFLGERMRRLSSAGHGDEPVEEAEDMIKLMQAFSGLAPATHSPDDMVERHAQRAPSYRPGANGRSIAS